MKTVLVDWNLIPYAEAWQRQTEWFDTLVRAKAQGEAYENRIIMCEHPHVYTLGRSGKENNMLLNDDQLKAIQATLFHIDRGGDITYHGPGQLVCYPILNLEEFHLGLKEYFALLSHASCDESFKMDSKLADLSLQTILTSIQLMYRNYSGNNHSNRKKEICRKLIQLITEHYKDQRCAQFYADQLGISLQHLSTTVKQVTGKSVLDTIAYIVIIDAKAQLKGTDMTIQEIAYSLNFPNPSFFCKFFRRHVGMSPLEFRNS